MKDPVYLVLISSKGGYVVHSIHRDEAKAKHWRECKEHDGEDVSIATVPLELVKDFANSIE